MRYLLYICLLFPALLQAAQFEVKGRRFAVMDSLMTSSAPLVNLMAGHIADHLKLLHDTHFPSTTENAVVSLETVVGVDAIFYPTGSYAGMFAELKDETVIAVNPRILATDQLWRLLGHEYFHLVHHQRSPNEVSWIREGLAQKFEKDVYGNITQGNVRAALMTSTRALEENFNTASPSPEQYGNTFLFFHHLAQLCDIDLVWKEFLSLPSTVSGRESIRQILTRSRSTAADCRSAESIMGSFVLAKLINQRTQLVARALWPQLGSMDVMQAEAQSLAGLPPGKQRRFFEALPPFLGLKLPSGVWIPLAQTTLTSLGVKVFILDHIAPMPRLTLWNGAPIQAAPNRQILLYKAR